MFKKRFLHIAAISVLGLMMVACERTSIGDIKADPGNFRDKEVSIAGRVTQSFGALGRGAYQIEDETGDLWVVSENRDVPSKGAYVGVKGKLAPSFTFMGRNLATVLRESDRKAVKAPEASE